MINRRRFLHSALGMGGAGVAMGTLGWRAALAAPDGDAPKRMILINHNHGWTYDNSGRLTGVPARQMGYRQMDLADWAYSQHRRLLTIAVSFLPIWIRMRRLWRPISGNIVGISTSSSS